MGILLGKKSHTVCSGDPDSAMSVLCDYGWLSFMVCWAGCWVSSTPSSHVVTFAGDFIFSDFYDCK